MSTGPPQEHQDLRWPYASDDVWPQNGNQDQLGPGPADGDQAAPAGPAWDGAAPSQDEGWRSDPGSLPGPDDDEDYEWIRYLGGGRSAQAKPPPAPARRPARPARKKPERDKPTARRPKQPPVTAPPDGAPPVSAPPDGAPPVGAPGRPAPGPSRPEQLWPQESSRPRRRELKAREQDQREQQRERQRREQERREQDAPEQKAREQAQRKQKQPKPKQPKPKQPKPKQAKPKQGSQQQRKPDESQLPRAAAAQQPVQSAQRARSSRRSRRAWSGRILWLTAGVLVIVVGVTAVKYLSRSSGGTAHVLVAPPKLGAYARNSALAGAMDAEALRTSIVQRSSGEARNVVDAVYEDATGSAAKSGPQIILFIGGNLTGTAPDAFITSFTGKLKGAVTTSPGSLGGAAACVPSVDGRLAECAWADNDTFGVIASPNLDESALASELRQMRPLVEHAAK